MKPCVFAGKPCLPRTRVQATLPAGCGRAKHRPLELMLVGQSV
jgi:hypothetical protein